MESWEYELPTEKELNGIERTMNIDSVPIRIVWRYYLSTYLGSKGARAKGKNDKEAFRHVAEKIKMIVPWVGRFLSLCCRVVIS